MRPVVRFIPPLLLFAIGLAAGAWFSIDRRAAVFSAGVDRRLAERDPAAAPPAVVKEGARAFATDDEMLTAIMSAVVEEEPLLRAHRLHELLGHLSSAELAVLFDRAVQTDDPERRDELLTTLLARWIAIDPAAAEAMARPYCERSRAAGIWNWRGLDSAVSRAWAQATPEAALAEAMAAPSAQWSSMTAQAAMETLTEGDAARQLEVLARLPSNRLRTQLCVQAITALAGKDPAAAEAALDLLPDARQRANLQASILGKLAERDPQAGLARLAALAPELTAGIAGTRLISTILQAAAGKDASAALEAIDGLPEEFRAQARNSVLVGWAGTHPLDAIQWAEANGVAVAEVKASVFEGDTDFFNSSSLLMAAFSRDRDKTLAWLRTQPASSERDGMMREVIWQGTTAQRLEIFAELTPEGRTGAVQSILNNLYQEDHDRAQSWAKELPPGDARFRAMQSLASYETRNAPDRVDALIDGWPAGPDRDATLRGIAGGLTQNDPLRAMEYARRVGDPSVREAALYGIANTWLLRDAAKARAWLTGTTEIPAETKRVLLRRIEER